MADPKVQSKCGSMVNCWANTTSCAKTSLIKVGEGFCAAGRAVKENAARAGFIALAIIMLVSQLLLHYYGANINFPKLTAILIPTLFAVGTALLTTLAWRNHPATAEGQPASSEAAAAKSSRCSIM